MKNPMTILLGNLSVTALQERIGITFPKDLIDFMIETHQPNAKEVKKGQWHCFDIPFNILCGDMETAQKIYDALKDKVDSFKEPLSISLS